MRGARTRGQPAALAAIAAMLATRVPHAVLLTGPAGVGKTTLALDLAAGLLCDAPPPERLCGECRGCRLVRSGNHPDVHRLAPEGAGGQIRIGDRGAAEPGTVRRLVADLALLPVEGGARVAIVEHADRMNEDAQSALLKPLEEPPAGVTIVLCADEEDRLLPTVRSRCARIRLGPVATREIEALVVEHGLADPPTGAQLARLASGRPGVALAYGASPEAVAARMEIARILLDLVAVGPGRRLVAASDLLELATTVADGLGGVARGARRAGEPGDEDAEPDAGTSRTRRSAADRRRVAQALVDIWRGLARDLAVAQAGDRAGVRDVVLLDDLERVAATLGPGAAAAFLERLTRVGALLDANVSPELAVDSLLVAWPRALGRAGSVAAA